MKLIKLNKGKFAQVSDHRFEELNKRKWYALTCNNGKIWYAVCHFSIGKKRYTQYMHIIIMGDNPNKFQIDHRDSDGLNNQDENLRFCTKSQNMANQRARKTTLSIYKGVNIYGASGKYRAHISCNGIRENLGCFITERDAAIAYNVAAIKHFGEFAGLNIIE